MPPLREEEEEKEEGVGWDGMPREVDADPFFGTSSADLVLREEVFMFSNVIGQYP